MNAGAAVAKYGKTLLGRVVETDLSGAWPGGPAYVTRVGGQDDIVMHVRGHQINPDTGALFNFDMGVFGYEDIMISPKERRLCHDPLTESQRRLEVRASLLRSKPKTATKPKPRPRPGSRAVSATASK